jgi:hypothetical protein
MSEDFSPYMQRPVRCLACGEVYDYSPMMPMCPRRYLTPHGEDFMEAVAHKLDQAGALPSPTTQQHKAAIRAAMTERRDEPSGA